MRHSLPRRPTGFYYRYPAYPDYHPKVYFQAISAEVMAEVADAMQKNDWQDFSAADCESRNHRDHRGDLWQCAECLRVFCGEEGADAAPNSCDDCWARVYAGQQAVFA